MANLVLTNRNPTYKDLDLDFLNKNMDGEYFVNITKSGEDAIKRSVRNLIFTNYYERPFRSYLGSGVRQMLFENATPLTANLLETAIRDVINNFEKRVRLLAVTVSADLDRNGFNVELQYVINNNLQPVITSIFLERIR